MALLPAVRLACLLLLVDLVVLAALARLAPALAQLGLAATWLEAGLRLPAFTAAERLLAPGGPRGAAVVLSLTPATFLTLRSLLVPYSAAPVLLATAAPAWLALTHGAAAAALLAWATPAPGEAVGTESPVAVRQLLALAWAEWPVLTGAFFFLVLAVLGETAGPYCTGKALDAIRSGNGLTAFTVGLVVAADLGRSLFAGCRGGLFVLAKARLERSTCHRLFSCLVRQDLAFFQGTPAAELSARLANDVPLLCGAVPSSVNVALRSLVTALGLGGFMVGLSPRLALLALLEVPLTITARKVYDARYQVLQRAMLDAKANTTAVVQEAVSSIETVQTFAGEEEEERCHSQALAKMLGLKDQIDVEWAFFTLVQRALQLAMQVLVLCHGHQQLREGTITTGSLVTFLLYQAKVGRHVQALVFGHGDLLSKAAAGHKTLEYLDREPTGDTGGTRAPTRLRGHVTFQCVSFAYPARPEHLVLQDVSFELRPGEVTALAGLNGSGKSTCAGLLERFYEPGAGEVLLDGVPLRDYEHRYLHRQVVLVGQEPVLFSGTIRDNITFGLEDCGEEAVRAAAAAAGALGFISALDRGFDTDVGEKGGQLSAGEKQRIAIARALVRQPTVLILDEATSALGREGEVTLQQWMRSGGARTVLLITHCPRMLEAADRIVVLEHGTVVETGTPAELRSRCGPYSRLLQCSPGAGRPETLGMGCGEQQTAPARAAGQEICWSGIGTRSFLPALRGRVHCVDFHYVSLTTRATIIVQTRVPGLVTVTVCVASDQETLFSVTVCVASDQKIFFSVPVYVASYQKTIFSAPVCVASDQETFFSVPVCMASEQETFFSVLTYNNSDQETFPSAPVHVASDQETFSVPICMASDQETFFSATVCMASYQEIFFSLPTCMASDHETFFSVPVYVASYQKIVFSAPVCVASLLITSTTGTWIPS
ncbi:antigen peptide transporter 2 [Gavia stellata]|uniref:antigen peptide transporter 2 n=1 Tax=Gavia stellata TaxID=37040 RepID=UPI0028A03120|nr:antigen peptide transporter 2 [Gavia stellata]